MIVQAIFNTRQHAAIESHCTYIKYTQTPMTAPAALLPTIRSQNLLTSSRCSTHDSQFTRSLSLIHHTKNPIAVTVPSPRPRSQHRHIHAPINQINDESTHHENPAERQEWEDVIASRSACMFTEWTYLQWTTPPSNSHHGRAVGITNSHGREVNLATPSSD